MKTSALILSMAPAVLGAVVLQAADVRLGLVAYWPLDAMSIDLTTTADMVSGYDLNLVNWSDSSGIVPGKCGNAFQFNGTSHYAYYTTSAPGDERLPVSRASSFSVMFWVKGAARQSDRRAFSESNNSGDNDPLVNIGTHNTGADGTIDLFFRNSVGTAQLNHLHSPGIAYDGTWHHVALTDVEGAVTLYLDGAVTMTARYTREATPIQDTTSIGAIVRAMGATIGAYFAGTIDEVAVWERALTQTEIQEVMNNGVQLPVPALGPFITKNPAGDPDLWVGDTIALSAAAGGVRPIAYQWLKDDAPIADAVAPTLALTALKVSDSGQYKLRASNAEGTVFSATATLVVNEPPSPNLTNQVVALWRLDEVQGTKTPDIVSAYDMDLVNLTTADVVPGKWGNCFQFTGSRQTMLSRIDNPGEALPIYQHPEFSVSLWVNGRIYDDFGVIIQTDRRVFAEGSTKNTNPLFNVGTHNSSTAPDGTVDSYIRSDTGAYAINHAHSTGVAFDGTWHHILYVQREIAGRMGAWFYIDGVLDPVALGPVRPLTLNTTTIGGILRNAASAWFTGQIDDVVVWNRPLTAAEAQLLATAPMPTPPANLQPLAISSFKADMPGIVQGDSATLRWDVSKTATEILIDNGVGDVTSKTVAGAGSVTVTPAATTVYTLTIKRGAEQITAKATVTVLTGVAANWAALDNFDQHNPGPVSRTAWWSDTRGDYAQIEDLNGNRMLTIRTTDSAAVLPIKPLQIAEGQERTLFFRMLLRDNPAATVRHVVGLTDKNVRNHGDTTSNIGPTVHATNDTTAAAWFLGVVYGVGGTVEYPVDPLQTGVVYSVWIDIKNVPMADIAPNDVFSVYIQKQGDTTRTELFKDYLSDRDPVTPDPVLGPMMPDLDKLIVSGNNTTASAWFDDFFISKSGYNATEPVPFNSGVPPTVGIALSGAQIEVSWSGGTLLWAPSIAGPWNPVSGATTSPYRDNPTRAQMYFQVMR